MAAAAERGAALARQLTALSRPKTATAATVDLAGAVRAIEHTLRILLPSSIQSTVTVPATPLVVRLDEVQAEQILLNLALNSRDAMPEGGRLEIRLDATDPPADAPADPAGRWARLTIRDTGNGMSPDIMARAFEPFFSTKEPSRGSGLGLSSVQAIVADAGGRVELDSAPGRGTIVSIRLPLVAAAAPESHPRPVPEPPKGRDACWSWMTSRRCAAWWRGTSLVPAIRRWSRRMGERRWIISSNRGRRCSWYSPTW